MASKKEKDNQQLSKARLHFYNTLISSEAYKEFKSVCGLSTKYSQLATPIFAFLENYGSFKDLFGNQDFIPTAGYLHNGIDATLDVVRAFGSEHNVFDRPTIKIKRVVTPAVSHQLLRFYATFIAPGAPLEVPFVTLPQREEISLELLHLVNSKLISGDIFDQVAKVVIETLFQRCFATYLKFKGVEYPAMKKSTVAHKEWAGSLELVEDKVSTPELSKKKLNQSLNG